MNEFLASVMSIHSLLLQKSMMSTHTEFEAQLYEQTSRFIYIALKVSNLDGQSELDKIENEKLRNDTA